MGTATTYSISDMVGDIATRAYKAQVSVGVMASLCPPRPEPVPLTRRELISLRVSGFFRSVRGYIVTLGYALRGDTLYTEYEYDANGEY